MSVKAEILTGKRRIIEYLLAPLTLYAHHSMKERGRGDGRGVG